MILLDRFLFYYAGLFTVIITLGALFSGFAGDNLLAFVLFLPVTFTITYQLVKSAHQLKISASPTQSSPNQPINRPTVPPFTISHFFAQRAPLFVITLALFVVTLTISVLRAGLDFLPQPQLLSPVPQSQLNSNLN